jgi:drug/metabolite transporter (DMT)-like permease
MRKTFTAVTARLAIASFLLMSSAMPVLAQVEEEAAEAAPESGAWKAFALAIFFGLAIGVGCFMSPKRSHQD